MDCVQSENKEHKLRFVRNEVIEGFFSLLLELDTDLTVLSSCELILERNLQKSKLMSMFNRVQSFGSHNF